MALRNGEFSGPAYDSLAEGTIKNTLSDVASTFREHDRPNPTKDDDGVLGRLLSRQYRAFRNEDPPTKQQKALPACVLLELAKMSLTATMIAIFQLAIFAFFFACRSCEYLLVPQSEQRRTDILRLRNIRFNGDAGLVPHDSPQLEYARSVSVTFEWQKKEERVDVVTQMATGHSLLCPVRILASIVRRIRSYPGATDDTKISAIWRNDRIEHITSKEMVDSLRAAVVGYGEDKLGFTAEDIGTHSIRSGSAMAMYKGEVPVYVIMMIGRWSSDAFLRYIRKQVEQFSHNVSKRMIRFLFHRHIPEFERSHSNNTATGLNIGGVGSQHAGLPAFSLFE